MAPRPTPVSLSWGELRAMVRGAPAGSAPALLGEHLDALLAGLPMALAVIDAPTGLIVHGNEALLSLLEGSGDEVLGTFYLDHVAPEDRERVRDYHWRRVAGDPSLPTTYEVLLVTVTGQHRAVELHVGPLAFPDAVMVLLRDLTQEKLYHEPLVHLQKMEGLSVLVGRISHQFNNLLSAVLGHASLLERRVRNDLQSTTLVKRIGQAATTAREALGQLLELGGGRTAFFGRISGDLLVRRLSQALEGTRPEGQGLTALEVRGDPWPLQGDLGRLVQAVLELVENAWDATGPGGRVQVVLENLVPEPGGTPGEPLPAGDCLAIRVDDDGPGIPLELRPRVVEPYFTTRGPASRDGLGLTLVWSIARELDGVLRLEDSPWGGARATLLLPRGPSPDAGLPVPLSAVGVPREAPMILVVDDQAFIGELIQEMLEPQGFRVETVTDPRVALQGLRGGALRPDLLLVDARMPDLDGRELAVAVHRQRPGLPIVLVSGYTGPSEVDGEAVKALAGFLRKPFTVDALLDVVRPLLGRSP